MTKIDNILGTMPSNVVLVGPIRYSYSCSLRYTYTTVKESSFPHHFMNVVDFAVPNVLSISLASRLQM
jgi:hypothetical protein